MVKAADSHALFRTCPRAPSVLALHGFTGGGADFAPLADAFPQLAWRAPDLPGHAPKPRRRGSPRDDSSLVAAIRYLDFRTRPKNREILLGYSLGARLALRFALARPRRFSALVLIAASPGLSDPAARAARREADEKLAQEILAGGVPPFLEQWRARPLIATQKKIPAAWRAEMEARRQRLRAEGLAASLREFGQAVLDPVDELLPWLRLPVLLVAGAEDPVYVAHAHAMQKQMPAAEVLIVPGAGHLAHLENLPAFAAGFGSFLSRLPDAARRS